MAITHSYTSVKADPTDGTIIGASKWNDEHVDSESVISYGALGDGSHDDTSAIQDAIDAVAATGRGGTVFFPPGNYKVTASLAAAARVCLMGSGAPGVTEGASVNGTRLVGDFAGPIIEATDTVYSFGVERMALIGSTTLTGSRGIYAHHAANQVCMSWVLRDLFFSSFADQAVYLQSGIAGTFTNIWVESACAKRADHSTYVGGFQLGDATHWFSDAYMEQVVSTCSFPNALGGYLSGYCCGIALLLTAGFVNSCVGHMSEHGFYIFPLSEGSHFVNCRSDLNQGGGWLIKAQHTYFATCSSYDDGRDAANTYSAFKIDETGSTFNTMVGCGIGGLGTVKLKYGVEDTTGIPYGTNGGTQFIGAVFDDGQIQTSRYSATTRPEGVDIGSPSRIYTGDYDPNAWCTANIGSLYLNHSTGEMHRKVSGVAEAGWFPLMQTPIKTKAGAIGDGDYPNTPADGTLGLDTSNHRLYIRSGGAWKYAALT